MNKIKIVDSNLDKVIDDSIDIKYVQKEGPFSINELKIKVSKNTKLYLETNFLCETKLSIKIDIKENINFELNILNLGCKAKIEYKYKLGSNSYCNVVKFTNVENIKELVNIDLNGEKANINYNFKSIGVNKQTYDYYINHKYKDTVSNIKNNSVCINKGIILYQVSTTIPKEITGCSATQNNRIINLTNNKCEIKPNLYIDCNDVEASHSALIGKFSEEELFYLQSRGIDYNTSLKLLINGFLTSDFKNKNILKEINKNIKKYWR